MSPTPPLPLRSLAFAAWSSIAFLLSGCFTTRTVSGPTLRELQKNQDEAAVLQSLDGPAVRLAPNSFIRVRRTDGTVSRWFEGKHLWTSDDGLLVSTITVPLSSIRVVTVTGATEADVALFRQLAPPNATVESQKDGAVKLQTNEGGVGPWLSAIHAARVANGTAPLGDTEMWTFAATYTSSVKVSGKDLGNAEKSGLVVVDGLNWEEVSAVEVRNLDGFATWFSVVSAPAWVGVSLLVVGVSGSFGQFSAGATSEVTARSDPLRGGPGTEQPLSDAEVLFGGVLRRTAAGTTSAPSARAVFDDGAKRKATVRPMAWVGVGGDLLTGRSSNLIIGGGARLSDVFELGLGVSSWWADPFGSGETLPGVPLAPGPPRWKPEAIGWLHAGCDFDVEATKRISLPLALQAGMGTGEVKQFRVFWGARVRIVKGLFVGIHPLNPQYTGHPDPNLSAWKFPSSLEVGSTF